MPQLDGSARRVELAPGYQISAPGLRGLATAHDAPPPDDRGPDVENATEAFVEALDREDFSRVKRIVLEVAPVPGPPPEGETRTPAGEAGLVLEVPDLGEDVGQVVMAVDEGGAVTWNFPLDLGGRPQTPSDRGPGGSKRFVIRNFTPASEEHGEGEDRGLLQIVGRKLLEILVYPLADPLLGAVSEYFAGKWEEAKRPYQLRRFDIDGYQSATVQSLTDDDWRHLAGGRSLWFIHGTFSTAHGGYARLPRETLGRLHAAYEGRVAAFNHFTLSVDPTENARRFAEMVPAELRLEMDLVGHSRGGLLVRSLAGEAAQAPNLSVRKAVMVGTPNHGTALADPEHITEMLDRMTSLLNLAPPGPVEVVAEILEAILAVVKMVGRGVLMGLDGLASMNPSGTYLQTLNAGPPAAAEYYAITSNFEPSGALRGLVKAAIAARDVLMDRVFETTQNDLVVPTEGVYQGSNDPAFPIPEDRRLTFAPSEAVDHGGYFAHERTTEKLLEWLAT